MSNFVTVIKILGIYSMDELNRKDWEEVGKYRARKGQGYVERYCCEVFAWRLSTKPRVDVGPEIAAVASTMTLRHLMSPSLQLVRCLRTPKALTTLKWMAWMRYHLTVITVTLLILGSQIHRLLEFVPQSSHKLSIVI